MTTLMTAEQIESAWSDLRAQLGANRHGENIIEARANDALVAILKDFHHMARIFIAPKANTRND